MRNLRFPVTLAFASALLSTPASADDWKAMLAKDRVAVASGKMVIEEYSLCKVKVPGASKTSFQLRSYAEVPVSAGISRDFLVSFESMMQTCLVLMMGENLAKGTSVAPLSALDCDPISAPIGKVDMEMNLYMTADGFQFGFVDGATGKTTQESKRWEDALGGK